MNAVGVTGSRYGHPWVKRTLGLWHAKQPITHLVLGCANGVDRQALEWALDKGVFSVVFTADWARLGNAAGPERNDDMVKLGRQWSALWFGFPRGEFGSRGTLDCMDRALVAGLAVWEVRHDGTMEGWHR